MFNVYPIVIFMFDTCFEMHLLLVQWSRKRREIWWLSFNCVILSCGCQCSVFPNCDVGADSASGVRRGSTLTGFFLF